MIFPPSIAQIRLRENRNKGIRLWLPVFLVWPLFLLLWVLYPLLALLAIVLWRTQAGRPLLFGLPWLTGLFCAARGLSVRVADGNDLVVVKIY